MSLLVIMIMWAGGSFAMRIQLWGAVNVWHHVSLLGMTLLVAGYYMFILAFLEEKHIPFTEDSTNSDTVYSRNLLRGVILPEAKQINLDREENENPVELELEPEVSVNDNVEKVEATEENEI